MASHSEPAFLRSSFPVCVPQEPALSYGQDEFEIWVRNQLKAQEKSMDARLPRWLEDEHDAVLVNEMMRTSNGAPAFKSSGSALQDLFFETEATAKNDDRCEMLSEAWKEDPLTTLRIIFNSRSIHLGQASRHSFYANVGWLARNHPQTFLANIQWLVRPVIPIAGPKKNDEDGDLIMVEDPAVDAASDTFDVSGGGSHGYWKDLLNLLVLASKGKLDGSGGHDDVYKAKLPAHRRIWNAEEARKVRKVAVQERFQHVVSLLSGSDPLYKCLHFTVARLFANQIRQDLDCLTSSDESRRRSISLAAKWAPSQKSAYDQQTFIVSSIAEVLHPLQDPQVDREIGLRHARELYRQDISRLRKHLQVVERDITGHTFQNIKYQRVPSIAMKNYAALFHAKDEQRFSSYISDVAGGKRKISGATLFPSTIVQLLRSAPAPRSKSNVVKDLMEQKVHEMQAKVAEGQWRTLVERIRQSGTLRSSIAVCDVSGSMLSPTFKDGTCPMDSSVGLSLLIADIAQSPFNGKVITFASSPQLLDVRGAIGMKGLKSKIHELTNTGVGYSTDFNAVFEKLLLPYAIENKVDPEEMVKQIFVFSDMQFNEAAPNDSFLTNHQQLKEKYLKAGYEMPHLIYWNLASSNVVGKGAKQPKPVEADTDKVSMVAGYSQSQLKVFLEGSLFDKDAEEESDEEPTMLDIDGEGDEEDAVVITTMEKPQSGAIDPMTTLKKAVGHKAYSMLKVVD